MPFGCPITRQEHIHSKIGAGMDGNPSGSYKKALQLCKSRAEVSLEGGITMKNAAVRTHRSDGSVLGLELGSTRIKAAVIGEDFQPSPPAAIPGKATIRTVFGPTTWPKSGPACVRRWRRWTDRRRSRPWGYPP